MEKNFSTKEMLDWILADTRTYKEKLHGVNFEVEKKNFLQDTEFINTAPKQRTIWASKPTGNASAFLLKINACVEVYSILIINAEKF